MKEGEGEDRIFSVCTIIMVTRERIDVGLMDRHTGNMRIDRQIVL